MTLQPKVCNICGGDVEYITNDKIYGKKYGSGYCYHCTKCGSKMDGAKMSAIPTGSKRSVDG